MLNRRVKSISFDKEFLEIVWVDNKKSQYNYRFLRLNCPCASCVDELSGQRLIEDSQIAPDIKPIESQYIGNYAIKIKWSDNHYTGIYSFRSLYNYAEAMRNIEQ